MLCIRIAIFLSELWVEKWRAYIQEADKQLWSELAFRLFNEVLRKRIQCCKKILHPNEHATTFSSKTFLKKYQDHNKKNWNYCKEEYGRRCYWNSKNVQENKVIDCPVSCNGTWQRCGFPSPNGSITIISIETEVLTRSCKQWQLQSHLDKDSEEYHLWRADHNNCTANFKGSAPAPWNLKVLSECLGIQ